MSYTNRCFVLPIFIAASLLSGSSVYASFDTFMVFTVGTGDAPPANGESQDPTFPNSIEVFSFSWGESNPTTIGPTGPTPGRVSVSSFNIMKKTDSSSPALFTASVGGKHYDTVKVSMRKTGTANVFLTYTFSNVYVESIQWSGSSGGDDTPTESVSLAFGGVTIEYTTSISGSPQTYTATWPSTTP
jgi:type VI secretion system secreted protein Hcp